MAPSSNQTLNGRKPPSSDLRRGTYEEVGNLRADALIARLLRGLHQGGSASGGWNQCWGLSVYPNLTRLHRTVHKQARAICSCNLSTSCHACTPKCKYRNHRPAAAFLHLPVPKTTTQMSSPWLEVTPPRMRGSPQRMSLLQIKQPPKWVHNHLQNRALRQSF